MRNGQRHPVNVPPNRRKFVEMPYYEVWWSDRTRKQKLLAYCLFAIILLVLICTFFYFMLSVELEICTTPTCVRTSMELLAHMDLHSDPCDDFYQFACGSFLKTTHLEGKYSSRSTQDIQEDEIQLQIRHLLESPPPIKGASLPKPFLLAKNFYKTCMNETAIEANGLNRIKQILTQIGGWPTVAEGLSRYVWPHDETFKWMEAVQTLRHLGINFDVFFTVDLDRSKTNPEKYILTIRDPKYSPASLSSELKTMYLDYMVDVAVIFGANKYRAEVDSKNVLELLLKLAKLSEEAAQNNLTTTYNPLTISELKYDISSIQWFELINSVLNPVEKLTYDDIVNVPDILYLRKLEQLLNSTPKRTLANFIAWQTVQQLINYLPAEILDRAYEFLGKVNGKMVRKPRWNTCVKATEDRLQAVISVAYVEQYFDETTKQRVLEIIRNIKTEFKYTLLRLEWLDDRTKDMAIEKLLTSVEEIVSYKDIMDSLQQSTIYDYVEIKEGDFLESALRLDLANLNYKFGKLRHAVQESWIRRKGFVTGLNIVFSPKENVLRFPVGLFRGIYYQNNRPEYLNYGTLGAIIAHEISHIFVQAEYRDLMGELRSWWSSHSLLNYETKLQCLTKQYGRFVVKELGKHLNSSNTRDEDLADLAGMKVAYETYTNWVAKHETEPVLPGLNYSPNQLFWISSAIRLCSKHSTATLQKYISNYPQSPKEFRVNGPLQNIPNFAFDFGCPSGSPMNPPDKCIIW